MYINRLTIIGFLGGDGEWQRVTEWHRVVVWGAKFAESAARLTKGAHVLVEGSLRSREYERDGVKHRVWECKADTILKLDRAQRADEQAGGEQQNAEQEEEAPV